MDTNSPEKIDWELIAYISRSKYRKKVMKHLYKAENPSECFPSRIADETGFHESNVSKALGELREKDIVTVLNPEHKKRRLYTLTEKGKGLCEYCC